MKNKKVIIGIIAIVVVVAIGITTYVILNKQGSKNVKKTLEEYFALINDKNYETMYEKVASMNMSKEDFIKRNKNIYEGIDSSDVKIEITEIKKEGKTYKIYYNEKMFTSAGKVTFSNEADIVKENKEYKIQWSSKLIFPELGENDKVRVTTIKAKRGSILDRNNNPLAQDRTNCISGNCTTEN